MKRRALLAQAGLTGAGLVVATIVGTREEERGGVVLQAARADLELIRYEDEHGFVELRPARGTSALAIDAIVSARTTEAPAPGLPTAPTPERRVRGSQHAESLFQAFAPMRAQRSLGVLDAATQAKLGFDATKRKLTIAARGLTHRFTLAVPPVGGMSPYLRNDDDGHVYLVPREFLNTFLPGATSERRLHTFAQDEIDRIVLTAGDKRTELLARPGEGQDVVVLSSPAAPGQGLPEVEAWHRALWTTEATETLGMGERPREGDPAIKLRVDYLTSRGQRLGWTEIGTAGMHGSEPWVFARTERSTGWLRLPSGSFAIIQTGIRLARDATGS